MHVTVVRVTDAAAPGKSVARFRYTMTTGEWTLYWPDNSGKFHRYKRTPGSKLVLPLLEAVDHNIEFLFTH